MKIILVVVSLFLFLFIFVQKKENRDLRDERIIKDTLISRSILFSLESSDDGAIEDNEKNRQLYHILFWLTCDLIDSLETDSKFHENSINSLVKISEHIEKYPQFVEIVCVKNYFPNHEQVKKKIEKLKTYSKKQ